MGWCGLNPPLLFTSQTTPLSAALNFRARYIYPGGTLLLAVGAGPKGRTECNCPPRLTHTTKLYYGPMQLVIDTDLEECRMTATQKQWGAQVYQDECSEMLHKTGANAADYLSVFNSW